MLPLCLDREFFSDLENLVSKPFLLGAKFLHFHEPSTYKSDGKVKARLSEHSKFLAPSALPMY